MGRRSPKPMVSRSPAGRGMKKHLLAVVLAAALISPISTPANARLVFDPWNYGQNILTAARSLQQINNQIQQLTNQAQMLINQAQNLQQLPFSIAGQLQSSLQQLEILVGDAQGLAYDVSAIDDAFQNLFPEEYAAATTTSKLVEDARKRWELARQGFHDALKMQAGVVENVAVDRDVLDQLITESQSAVGNLQVLQAGNQLTALAAKQSMQLQELIAANARADALERAGRIEAREQGRARLARFIGTGSAYTRK